MSESKLNKRLLRKVRNRIAEIPESYNQTDWMQETDAAPCGTAACLAGEAIICAAPSVKQGVAALKRAVILGGNSSIGTFSTRVPDRGAKLLGISGADAKRVFDSVPQWPAPFGGQIRDAIEKRQRKNQARIAVKYLDECLKRGRVTW